MLFTHLRQLFSESYRNLNHPAEFFDVVPLEKEERIVADFESSKMGFMLSAFIDGEFFDEYLYQLSLPVNLAG